LVMARDRAGKIPMQIVTDQWNGYKDSIKLSYCSNGQHIQIERFHKDTRMELIELWQAMLRDRLKVMRGLKKEETANLILDGFLVNYNFFSIQESLCYQTPAQLANAKFNYRSWMEVICKPYIKETTLYRLPALPSVLLLGSSQTAISETATVGQFG
jgi:hypothetical protein